MSAGTSPVKTAARLLFDACLSPAIRRVSQTEPTPPDRFREKVEDIDSRTSAIGSDLMACKRLAWSRTVDGAGPRRHVQGVLGHAAAGSTFTEQLWCLGRSVVYIRRLVFAMRACGGR